MHSQNEDKQVDALINLVYGERKVDEQNMAQGLVYVGCVFFGF